MQPSFAPSLATQPASAPDQSDMITVVIETSKGSRNRFACHSASGTFRLKHVVPEGSVLPYDFGFILSTRGGGGDPLNVLVFLDEPAPLGSVVAVRLIGVLEARQRTSGGDWEENSRFLGVAAPAQATAHVSDLDDLRPGLVDENETFFVPYDCLRDATFEVRAPGGSERARQLVDNGIAPAR